MSPNSSLKNGPCNALRQGLLDVADLLAGLIPEVRHVRGARTLSLRVTKTTDSPGLV